MTEKKLLELISINPNVMTGKPVITGIVRPREKAMVLIMLDCSLRVGEIHNLSLDDFSIGAKRAARMVQGP
jgi:uncharacterized protein (DUF433 family)